MSKQPRSPRTKKVPASLTGYDLGNKRSGVCPKCHVYVEDTDEGVECETCQAYWHFSCVGVTQKEIDENWNDKPFLCLSHRQPKSVVDPVGSVVTNKPEVRVLVHKVHSYTLNPHTAVKKHLTSLNTKPKIQPRDQEQQYNIRICPPSYEILTANITEFGKQWGITVKADDVDREGTEVGKQFNINLTTISGLQAEVSMNCYCSNSSLHLQLNKGTKGLKGWKKKLQCFSHFVTHNLKMALELIEKTQDFIDLKERMRDELEAKKANLIKGTNIYPLTTKALSTEINTSKELQSAGKKGVEILKEPSPSNEKQLDDSPPSGRAGL